MGRLALLILDGPMPAGLKIEIDESGDPFQIEQSTDDGCLYVANYHCMVNGECVTFMSVYNSKSNFPLHCWHRENFVEVFDDAGDFTNEFISFAKTL